MSAVEALDRPLPKPVDASYVEAKLLEALVEACLALRSLQGERQKRRWEGLASMESATKPRCYA